MSGDSPAVILFDTSGNPIGIAFDGNVYRVSTDARITDGTSFAGITDVLGEKALKVDVIKTVSSGSVGSGGTSSNFDDPFPIAGTAVGYSDGSRMRDAMVYDLDMSGSTEFVIGTNLRTFGLTGSVEVGTLANPLIVSDGYLINILANQTNGTQHTIVDSGIITVNQGTSPWIISGTITANIGTTNGLALESTLDKLTILQNTLLGSNTQTLIGGSVKASSPSYADGYIQPLSLTTSGALRVDAAAHGKVSAGNASTALLGSNAVFTGVWEEVTDYAYISISIISDQSSANEGFAFQWSADGINIDRSETTDLVGASNGRAFAITIRARYFRIVYTNGTVAQGVFRLGSVYHSAGTGIVTKSLDSTINDDNLAQLVESVITGKREDGYYGHVVVDNQNRLAVTLGDSAFVDAFGRLRTSTPYTVFDGKFLTDKSVLFWDDQQTSGSGTTSVFVTNQSMVNMSVGNLTAGKRVRQTFRRFNYQPGKSMLISFTSIFGSGAAGITRRAGYFDGYNGLYFDLTGTTLGVVVRTFTSGSVVNTKINQSNWNRDKLDGTGTSGITLDTSKDQIFIIDFQWLGSGRIRYGFDLDGTIVYCHEISNSNINSISYMQIPNLPLRHEISNDGTGASASLLQICSVVIVEGGVQDTGFVLSVDRGTTVFTTASNANLYPTIAMRLKSTALSATITPIQITIVCSSNAAYKYALILNPTVTGASFSFTGITGSAIEADVGTTNATTVSGGTVLISGYGQAGGSTGSTSVDISSNISIGSNIAGVADVLVLAVARITGTSEDFSTSLTYREEI